MFDLLLKGGRIVDPRNGLDEAGDIGFRAGRVAAVGADLPTDGTDDIRDVAGRIVAPGLIDLHTHVYVHGSWAGVDPDKVARASGAATLVDAGTAGAGNFAGLRHHVIEPARARILAFLNVSFPGLFGFAPGIMVGECLDLRLLHAGECLRVGRENADLIVGIKVRIGDSTSGTHGTDPLDIALEIAEELGLPVMTHIGAPPPDIGKVLARLREGDILTHCFRPYPNALVDENDAALPAYLEARARGVVFDIGHGIRSFGFRSARAMMEHGYPPDVISSDVHALSIDGPAYDLLVTMSKFLNLGMSAVDVIRAATAAPAAAIGRSDLGHLGVGAAGDAAVLHVEKGAFGFEDAVGERLMGDRRFALDLLIMGGAPSA